MKGKYAFNLVLDKLLEATLKTGTNDGELMEARHRFSVRDEVVKTLEAQVKVLQEDADKARPILNELWEAADKLVENLGVAPVFTQDQKRLKLAVKAARSLCELPF